MQYSADERERWSRVIDFSAPMQGVAGLLEAELHLSRPSEPI